MSVVGVNLEVADRGSTISIEGRFDLLLYDAFHAAYSQLTSDSTKITVNLAHTDYLDSSGLGMLLMLREHFDSTAEIHLVNPGPDVARTLAIANFDKLFFVQTRMPVRCEDLIQHDSKPPLIYREPESEPN